MDFQKFETDAMNALHKVLAEAESHEPAIDAAVNDALAAVGAPPEVAAAAEALIASLLNHFQSGQSQPEPQPEPAVTG